MNGSFEQWSEEKVEGEEEGKRNLEDRRKIRKAG